MGKSVGDLIPKTGNLKANRVITKQTGELLNRFNDALQRNKAYSDLSDDRKLEFLKGLISSAKKTSKVNTASELAGIVRKEVQKSRPKDRRKTLEGLSNRGLLTEPIKRQLVGTQRRRQL